MSTINRLLSRRDKHHASHKEKVMLSPATHPTSSSLFTRSGTTSSVSVSTVSLAFCTLLPKRSPRLQAALEPIECSSANPTSLLLQPKQHGGPLEGLFVPEEKERTDKPEKGDERKVV